MNYLFHENYDETASIERLRNEHFWEDEDGSIQKRVTDSHMKISCHGEENYYHIECESGRYDDSFLIKIIRYDSMIAVDRSKVDGYVIHLEYPHSALILLRNKGNPPGKAKVVIKTPGGEVSYEIPILCEADCTIDTIFQERLYFLIPFYIFKAEKVIKNEDADEAVYSELKTEYETIGKKLGEEVDAGRLSRRSSGVIISLMRTVADRLSAGNIRAEKRVGEIMRGQYGIRCEWLEKYDSDMANSREEGRTEGREEGKADYLVSLVCRKLRKGKDFLQIAEELDEDQIRIKTICDAAAPFAPEYDEKKVSEALGVFEMD